MNAAVFDINDHAITPGWATYHKDTPTHPHIEASPPSPADGHSPLNYARCACGAWVKWFVVGQHRYSEPRECDCPACTGIDPCDERVAEAIAEATGVEVVIDNDEELEAVFGIGEDFSEETS